MIPGGHTTEVLNLQEYPLESATAGLFPSQALLPHVTAPFWAFAY